MFDNIFLGFLLSILLGGLVGAQRESRRQRQNIVDFAGLRSFIFISLLGFLLGYISLEIFGDYFLVFIGFFGVFALVVSSYILSYTLRPGSVKSITGQMSAIITFLVGLLVSLGFFYLAIMLSIIVTTILFFGDKLHKFAGDLKEKEIYATLKFAIIAFVILPILPNKNYTPLDFPFISAILYNQNFISIELLRQLDVFNFYHIWLMVVFISAIGYVGYILMKTVGAEKGSILTGFLAGFMSSTALTSGFAIESKRNKALLYPLVVGTVIASSTMFIRIIFEIAIINPALLPELTFFFVFMGIVGYLIAFFLYNHSKHKEHAKVKVTSPFSIGPALKFGFFFMFVLFFSKLFSILFGSSGVYLVSFFSGVADVDAITISLLDLAKNSQISERTATIGIVLAAFANTLFKGGIAYYLGSRHFGKTVFFSFLAIIGSGVLFLLISFF